MYCILNATSNNYCLQQTEIKFTVYQQILASININLHNVTRVNNVKVFCDTRSTPHTVVMQIS